MEDIIDAIVKDMRDRPDAWTLNKSQALADFNGTIIEVFCYFGQGLVAVNGVESTEHAPKIEAAMRDLKCSKTARRFADLRKALNLEGGK